MSENILESFIREAANILGETKMGLRGSDIAKLCNTFAYRNNVNIPYGNYPFKNEISKREALYNNLMAFKAQPEIQYRMIKDMCKRAEFRNNKQVRDLENKLVERYGTLDKENEFITEESINDVKHWLQDYPKSYGLYCKAMNQYQIKGLRRNILDDLRLALELLLKELFHNNKSFENQINNVGELVNSKGGSKEFVNMFNKFVDYYADYQNTYVKHDNNVPEIEIECMIELTSTFMKQLIKLAKQ